MIARGDFRVIGDNAVVLAVLNEEVLDTFSRQGLESLGTGLSCTSRHSVDEGACGPDPNGDRPRLKASGLRKPRGECSQRGLIRCIGSLDPPKHIHVLGSRRPNRSLILYLPHNDLLSGDHRLCVVQDRQRPFQLASRPTTPHNWALHITLLMW